MTSKNGGFDAGEFYDDGVEQAGLSEQEVVTDSPENEVSANVVSQVSDDKATEKPEAEAATEETTKAEQKEPSAEDVQAALESTKETEQEVESVIESLIPKPEDVEAAQEKTDFEPGKYVPVDDHIKLRERAQKAERERDELQQQLEASTTQTGGEKPGEAEKSPFEKFVEENPDEEITPPKVLLEDRKWQDAQRQKAQQAKEKAEQAEREKQAEQHRKSEAIKSLSSRAVSSEAEFRKATTDYDSVTKPVVQANLLTNAEKLEFLKAENPAQKLYEICKAKTEALRGVLGKADTTTPPSKKPTDQALKNAGQETAVESEMTDDEIFDEVFKADQEE